jgi:hypothetical protein
MKRLLLSALSLMLGTASFSQVVFIDEFNYGGTAGALTTSSSGAYVAHSGAGTNALQYTNTGLSVAGYTAAVSSGGSMTFLNGAGTREDVNRAISPAVTTGSVYASFILRVTASGGTTGDYNVHFIDGAGATPGSTFRARLFIKDGSVASTFKLGISKAGAAAVAIFTTADYNLNQDYLVVLKYEIVAGATNDNCSAFIFSSSIPATEPTADITATDVATADLTQVASIALRQGSVGVSAGQIDGLRISTIWTNAQLPVTLTSFTATRNDDATILRWATASESNNSHFEIQRSVDNKKFEVIGTVRGNGTSTKKINYSFTDVAVLSAKTVYYRLKQVDFDGKAEYSKTVSVVNTLPSKGISSTLPNPFNDELSVSINAGTATNATVVIMDMIGKVHHTSTQQLQAGSTKVEINTSDMPDGIYFVRVSYNGETYTQKVIKK